MNSDSLLSEHHTIRYIDHLPMENRVAVFSDVANGVQTIQHPLTPILNTTFPGKTITYVTGKGLGKLPVMKISFH